MAKNRQYINHFMFLVDLVILISAYLFALFITLKRLIIMPEVNFDLRWPYLGVLIVFLFSWIIYSGLLGLYDEFKPFTLLFQSISLIKCLLVQTISAALFLFIIKDIALTRYFLMVYVILLTLFLSVVRVIFTLSMTLFHKKGKLIRKIIIIGYNQLMEEFVKTINSGTHPKYKIYGIMDDQKPPNKDFAYLGPLNKLSEILEKYEVDELIISLEGLDSNQKKTLFYTCRQYPVRTKILSPLPDDISHNFPVLFYGNFRLISTDKDPLNRFYARLTKRLFDIIFSLLIFIFIFPWLWPITALAIKLNSKGPVLFKQERWGEKNKRIVIYKFRTMKQKSSASKNNPDFKQARMNDPRFTKIGSILRKTNLDEFPQFLNVLLGNMSIVGPRPHPTPLNQASIKKIHNYLRRHMIKPGITGLAQIKGYRGETKDPSLMQKRINYDILYINNWSIWLDIQIVIITVLNMIKGDPNAY